MPDATDLGILEHELAHALGLLMAAPPGTRAHILRHTERNWSMEPAWPGKADPWAEAASTVAGLVLRPGCASQADRDFAAGLDFDLTVKAIRFANEVVAPELEAITLEEKLQMLRVISKEGGIRLTKPKAMVH